MQRSYNSYLPLPTDSFNKNKSFHLTKFIKVIPVTTTDRHNEYVGKKAEPEETGFGNHCKRNNEWRRD